MNPQCFGILADKPPVLRKSWPINSRCFCILADKPPVLNPNFFSPWFGPTLMARKASDFFPPLVWTYPDGSVGALHLAAARPCDLRVPRDCVAEWRFMSRKQKNSSQDPPTKKARSNIWSKKKSDRRQKCLCEPVRRPREIETRVKSGGMWR